MKILVISLAGIGDTLLATPLIQGLRAAYPQARLEALVMWGGAKHVLEGNPHLDGVCQENLLQLGRLQGLRRLWPFHRQHYDLSLNTYPQGKIIYRVTAWYIHAARRLSHVYENHTWLDHLLITDALEQDYQIHCVDNNLKLLEVLGAPVPQNAEPQLYFTAAEKAWADDFARQHALVGKRVLGLHIGSGKTKNLMLKRWPVDYYTKVLKYLFSAFPELVGLLFGGPDEKEENELLIKELNSARLIPVPSRSMKEAAAALGKCELFLSVDNVFMHLAATMKVPRQIVIESPTFNKTIEPYHRPFRLVPNPMVAGRNLDYYRYDGRNIRGGAEHLRACMRSITPEMVIRAVEEELGK